VILDMALTPSLTQGEVHSNLRSARAPSHRRRALRALFVHRDADAIESCVQELQKAQFTVSSDCVLNLAQCAEQLRSRSYDVLIVPTPLMPSRRILTLSFTRIGSDLSTI
jgi:hypothetical protein